MPRYQYQWVPFNESERWNAAVRACGHFDTYHQSAYHAVVSSQSECFVGCGGEPFLFVYEEEVNSGNISSFHTPSAANGADSPRAVGDSSRTIGGVAKKRLRLAVPILRRRLDMIPGLESIRGYDAISAYGYPGLLVSDSRFAAGYPTSRTAQAAERATGDLVENAADAFDFSEYAVIRSRFQKAFLAGLQELEVTSFFGRCHPLFPSERFWYAGIAEIRRTGQTVALDLSLSEEAQQRQLRRDTRSRLRQAHEAGVTVRVSDDIDRFILLYNTTMRSVGASSGYFFERSYYEQLFATLGPQRLKMLFAEYDGEVVASAIFLLSVPPDESHPSRDAVIQYHLSGSLTNACTKRWGGGTRLLLDWMRRFGVSHGYRWLHLGGGLGGRGPGDPLFDFKAGFSKRYFEFDTVRWIVDPEKYERLVSHRLSGYSSTERETILSSDFFPLYRCS